LATFTTVGFSKTLACVSALLWVIKERFGKLTINLSNNQLVVLLAIYYAETRETHFFDPGMLEEMIRKIETKNDLAAISKQEIDKAASDLK